MNKSQTIPGLAEAGHNFYALGGVERLRDGLGDFRSGRLVVMTAAPTYKCPAAPYEAAMLLEYDCRSARCAARSRSTSTPRSQARWALQDRTYLHPLQPRPLRSNEIRS